VRVLSKCSIMAVAITANTPIISKVIPVHVNPVNW
jgi:hypothetical protein